MSSRVVKFSLTLSLLGAFAFAVAGCGSDDEETGALTKAEKRYIANMETHQENLQKRDAQLTTGTLRAKQEYPQGGLPTELMNGVQDVLDARRKMIRFWDDAECPSDRFGTLCDQWTDTLNAQYRWDDALIAFINKPYSEESFKSVLEAGRKEATLWQRCEAEIRQIQRDAAGG